jgi:hypothetical protein
MIEFCNECISAHRMYYEIRACLLKHSQYALNGEFSIVTCIYWYSQIVTTFNFGRNSNDRLMMMAGTRNLQLNCGLKHTGNPVTTEFSKLELCSR